MSHFSTSNLQQTDVSMMLTSNLQQTDVNDMKCMRVLVSGAKLWNKITTISANIVSLFSFSTVADCSHTAQ